MLVELYASAAVTRWLEGVLLFFPSPQTPSRVHNTLDHPDGQSELIHASSHPKQAVPKRIG